VLQRPRLCYCGQRHWLDGQAYGGMDSSRVMAMRIVPARLESEPELSRFMIDTDADILVPVLSIGG
jgi:hypothetical protein